jgi:hypothetical protein
MNSVDHPMYNVHNMCDLVTSSPIKIILGQIQL